MTILHIDFETRSACDLKAAGLDNYAKHPSTEVLCMAWHYSPDDFHRQRDGDENSSGVFLPPFNDRSKAPPWLQVGANNPYALHGATVVAHNAAFELAIWNNICVPRYGWPPLKPEQVHCTMAMAYAMALPGSLENAAAAVGLDVKKDAVGYRLMLKMCKPKADGTWHEKPEDLERLYQYCKTDVEVERQLYDRLLELSPAEQDLWVLDQRINNRGVYVDLPTITTAIQVVEQEQTRLNAAMRKTTGGAVATCTANGQLADWLRYRGVDIPGVAKADVIDALGTTELPDDCRNALLLRQEAAKSSTAKLKAMAQRASSDNRVRNTMQYHGAATGRWAGRGIQTHNFPRPALGQGEIEAAIELLAVGDRDSIDLLYGAPMDVISSCLRGMICAAPGHDLIAADFSAIEARVLAWLAGEERVLDIFRGKGKIYEHAAAGIYSKGIEAVTKDERQIGKVAVLALGYQGGVGAFQTMARAYGVVVSDARADEIKVAWRSTHPNIVKYWYALESAAVEAVLSPGVITTAGHKSREVKFRQKGSFLFCRLPSGRILTYPYPKIVINKFEREALQYMGVNGVTGKWEETDTYGGKLAENITQAVARDLLASGITALESADIPVVFHVHDEIVVEIPSYWEIDNGVRIVEELMARAPDWALELPLKAEGWRGRRYRK